MADAEQVKPQSDALENMALFWKQTGGKTFVEKYSKYAQQNVTASYITRRGRKDTTRVDDELERELSECRILIMTANEVESRTLKRLLFEESKSRKIYKYWKYENEEDDVP